MTRHSSLAPFAASMREADPDGARHYAAKLLRETGMIVLDPAWIQGWGDRELVRKIAERTQKNWGTRT